MEIGGGGVGDGGGSLDWVGWIIKVGATLPHVGQIGLGSCEGIEGVNVGNDATTTWDG